MVSNCFGFFLGLGFFFSLQVVLSFSGGKEKRGRGVVVVI